MKRLRAIAVLLAALAASGCVWFETIPAQTVGCDPELVGVWEKIEGDKRERITIPPDCVIRDPLDPVNGESLAFKTFTLDGARYAAIEAREPRRPGKVNTEETGDWPEDRVMLLRYRLDGPRLSYWFAKIGPALDLHGNGVVAHVNVEDENMTPASVEDVRKMNPPYSGHVYLTGSREALAEALRKHQDVLFSNLAPEAATVMLRVEAEAP